MASDVSASAWLGCGCCAPDVDHPVLHVESKVLSRTVYGFVYPASGTTVRQSVDFADFYKRWLKRTRLYNDDGTYDTSGGESIHTHSGQVGWDELRTSVFDDWIDEHRTFGSFTYSNEIIEPSVDTFDCDSGDPVTRPAFTRSIREYEYVYDNPLVWYPNVNLSDSRDLTRNYYYYDKRPDNGRSCWEGTFTEDSGTTVTAHNYEPWLIPFMRNPGEDGPFTETYTPTAYISTDDDEAGVWHSATNSDHITWAVVMAEFDPLIASLVYGAGGAAESYLKQTDRLCAVYDESGVLTGEMAIAVGEPASVNYRQSRIRYQIPSSHEGTYFAVRVKRSQIDLLTDAVISEVIEVVEWTGPGSGGFDDPSWFTPWVEIAVPATPNISEKLEVIAWRHTHSGVWLH